MMCEGYSYAANTEELTKAFGIELKTNLFWIKIKIFVFFSLWDFVKSYSKKRIKYMQIIGRYRKMILGVFVLMLYHSHPPVLQRHDKIELIMCKP